MTPSLFIGIPKTASKSMYEALRPHGLHEVILRDGEHGQSFDPASWLTSFHHAGIPELQDAGILTSAWLESRWKFAFIRNPWDRTVSLYFYLFTILGRHRKTYGDISFTEFVDIVTTTEVDPVGAYNWRGLSQARPQADWLGHWDGKLAGFHYAYTQRAFIGKLEHIEEVWPVLCRLLGINPLPQLPHVGPTNRRPYQEYYTPALCEAVATYYQKDVELGQYEF